MWQTRDVFRLNLRKNTKNSKNDVRHSILSWSKQKIEMMSSRMNSWLFDSSKYKDIGKYPEIHGFFLILIFQRILKSIICQWVVWWRRELAWFVNVTSRNNYHLKLPYLCYSFWIIDLNQLTKLADLNYTRSSSLAAIFFNLQKFLHFVISSLQLLFFFFSITLKTVYVLLQ